MLQMIARAIAFCTSPPFDDLTEQSPKSDFDVPSENPPLPIADQRLVNQPREHRIVEKLFDPESR